MSNSPEQAPTQRPDPQVALQQLFRKLKTIRNVSLGIGSAGTGVLVGSAYRTLGPATITAAATVTLLAFSTAATAQLLLTLNESLEALINQPPSSPKPGQSA